MNRPFLTDFDKRGEVKGTIDPLGELAIWTRFGRTLVGNLTTVSVSARDFSVLLVGSWLAQRARALGASDQDLPLFLKWEALTGYSRVRADNAISLRGIERVRRNINSGDPLRISTQQADQILSNQKMYGLWGLFTVPARRSGLLMEDEFRLTPAATAFVEGEYVPRLAAQWPGGIDDLVALLMRDSFTLKPEGMHEALVKNLGGIFGRKMRKAERAFFRGSLLYGTLLDETGGIQAQLAGLVEASVQAGAPEFDIEALKPFVGEANRQHKESPLGQRLEGVRRCEGLIGCALDLFLFMLGNDGKTLVTIAKGVKKVWGSTVDFIDAELCEVLRSPFSEATSPAIAVRWMEVAQTLETGAYASTCEHLLAINAEVMRGRGSAAWAELRSGKLFVKTGDQARALPEPAALEQLWHHSYFLDSMRLIAAEIAEA